MARAAHRSSSCLVLVALLASAGAALPPAVDAAVGRTPGSFSVSPNSGAATYTIPIWVQPGPRGIQPSIALTYNSGSRGGMVGVGWALAGLSSITRCGKTYAQDSVSTTVTLTYADVFCIDEKRLRLTSSNNLSTYGQPGTTYQTELADFSTVTASVATAGNGPESFVVKGRDGLTYIYGTAGNSRVLASGSTTAVSWMLNEVKDRNNNRMIIEYRAPSSNLVGSTVPQKISWTPSAHNSSTYNYEMEFEYVTNENASSIGGYVAGTTVLNADLLTSISIKSAGTVVKKYVLGYSLSSTTGAARLNEVKECADAAASNCLSPTAIGYQNGQSGTATAATTAVAGNYDKLTARYDLNGDGYSDIAYRSGSTWYVSFGSQSGFAAGVAAPFTGYPGVSLLFGNLQGGTSADGVLAKNGSVWTYYERVGSSWTTKATGLTFDTAAAGAALADVDGDGRPDLATMYYSSAGSGSTTVHTRMNTSTPAAVSFAASSTLVYTRTGLAEFNTSFISPDSQYGTIRQFDFNGDGREDLAWMRSSCSFWNDTNCFSVVNTVYSLTVQPNGTLTDAQLAIGSGVNLDNPVDFVNWNHDLCTDVLTSTAVLISACTGSTASSISTPSAPYGMVDWNGDGRSDLVLRNTSTSNAEIRLSTGSGFGSAISTSVPLASNCFVMTLDANGDGLEDIGCWRNTGFTYFTHNGDGTPPDLATSFTDGFGITSAITYKSLARAASQSPFNYERGSAQHPKKVFTSSSYHIVTTVAATDETGILTPDHSYTTNYRFSSGEVDLQGRGFSGMGLAVTNDSRNGFDRHQEFRKDFPYTGRMFRDRLYTSTALSTLLYERNFAFAAEVVLEATANNKRGFVYVDEITEERRGLGSELGQIIQTTEQTLVRDSYGNPTSVSTTITDNGTAVPYGGQQWTTTIAAAFTPQSGSDWCVNLPTSVTVTNTSPGPNTIARTTNFATDYAKCRHTGRTIAPSTPYSVVEAYAFDAFGNINTLTVTGNSMSPRVSYANWGTTGQFQLSETNAVGHVSQTGYNFALAVPTSYTDPNNLVLRTLTSDAFGRTTQETRIDGTYTTWSYEECSVAGCVNNANRVTVTESTFDDTGGTPRSVRYAYFDRLDRPVALREPTISGYSRVERQYDEWGRIEKEGAPCDWSTCTSGTTFWATAVYDDYDRPVSVSRPISATNGTLQTATFQYDGRGVTLTDPQGKQQRQIISVAGTLLETRDHNGYYHSLTYDAWGSLLSVTDSLSNALFSATYDYGIEAFQKTATDVSLGASTSSFNALGELVSYVDAKGQQFLFSYDAISRPLMRDTPDLDTSWTWGTGGLNKGKLESVSAGGYIEAYTYDNKARLTHRTLTLPSDGTYTYQYDYHADSGLLDSLTYPTSTSSYRLKLRYGYQNGLLKQISDFNAASTVFWVADTANSRGQVTKETLGNGVVTNRSFDAVTGWLTGQTSGVGANTNLQNESYLMDLVGNVTQRQNNQTGLSENFHYDNVYRLDYSDLGGVTNLDLSYDAKGNITARSDVANNAAWTYHPTKKHAVTQAGSAAFTYTYDLNGNMTSRSGANITWTSFNHPSTINGAAGESVQFSYNHNHERWRAILSSSSGVETTYFVGELMEKVVSAGLIDYRHFILAGGTKIAVYSRPSVGSDVLRYIREDHLGSVAAILNSNGTSYVKESFSAFGSRRNSCTWSGAPTSGQKQKINSVTRRGYTWHTALGDMGLIDMNGRIQDSVTGRFISPDPGIPDPTNTQSYNRYSYVMNNPLSLIDPTGFSDEPPPPTVTVSSRMQKKDDREEWNYSIANVLAELWNYQALGRADGVFNMEGLATVTVSTTKLKEPEKPEQKPPTTCPEGSFRAGDSCVKAMAMGMNEWLMPGGGAQKAMRSLWSAIRGFFSSKGAAAAKAVAQAQPKLQRIHSVETLTQGSSKYGYEAIKKMSTDDIVKSLRPGAPSPLKVGADGRIFDGNTRILVLEQRGFDVNSLPRVPYP